MRKGFIGFSHLVHIFSLFHGPAPIVVGIDNFIGEFVFHRTNLSVRGNIQSANEYQALPCGLGELRLEPGSLHHRHVWPLFQQSAFTFSKARLNTLSGSSLILSAMISNAE